MAPTFLWAIPHTTGKSDQIIYRTIKIKSLPRIIRSGEFGPKLCPALAVRKGELAGLAEIKL